ncbi:unnamed protein product [Trifolium pratense]|uniref:Uncharacterized protein n=1 Tax=Trifolium pratense TaxID=57577 RepID=A0ACB0IJA7_TRIPR|nr:unnamed protein product [Trifolium pratense]
MQAIVSIPFDFSSDDFSTNPGTCFCEHVGVKAPGTAKRTAFLPFVRSETVMVWTSPAGSRYEKVDSGSLSPTEMVAEILEEVENRRGFGLKRLSLRGRVKLEERVLVLGDKSDVVVEEERSLEKEREVAIDENFEVSESEDVLS